MKWKQNVMYVSSFMEMKTTNSSTAPSANTVSISTAIEASSLTIYQKVFLFNS